MVVVSKRFSIFVPRLLALAFVFAALGSDVLATDVIYLNRCEGNCTVSSGTDDAVNHVTSLTSGSHNLLAFPYGDAAFASTAGCLRRAFARYDVTVTTTDPGSVPRREIMLAGFSQNLGLPSGIPSIAPLYAQPRDNAIVFVFAEFLGGDIDRMCWLAAQNVGFLYALDNELHCPDLMSTETGCGLKSFVDITVNCGTTAPQMCFAGGTTQNSAAKLAISPGIGDRILLADFENPGPSP